MKRVVIAALVICGLASACTYREHTTVQKPAPATTTVVTELPPPPPPSTTTVIMR